MLTLPVTVVLAVALWAAGGHDRDSLLGLAATLALTYFIMEMVNRNQLIRVRSRLVSASFLALATTAHFLHPIGLAYVPPFCLLVAYGLLFSAYQKPRAEGEVFYAFLALGAGGFAFPPLWLLAVVLWFCMAAQLRVMTWRTLTASVFGLALPAWVYVVWMLWQGRQDEAFGFVHPYLARTLPPDFAAVPVWQWVNAAFLGVLVLLGLLHYYRTNFNDKIRVRMCYYTIICVELPLVAALCLLPDCFETLYLLLLVNSAPLVGHYFALARGRRLMDIWLWMWLVGLIVLWTYNAGFLNPLFGLPAIG